MKIIPDAPPRVWLIGTLLMTVALVAGCVAGAGSVAHRNGDLDTTLAANVTSSARAAQMTVVQLGYTPISDRQDAMHAILIVRNPADQRLEIYLQKADAANTRLKIRLSPLGNEAVQHEILALIRSNL